ncbi:hypothetical protein KY361_02915 [Candidatus Woesearchaeota archaeon]|nr:hypothetical protein [Candidatus Woesearchaeota archaeon]
MKRAERIIEKRGTEEDSRMVEYNIVKYCRICRERFVVGRRESKKQFCDKCQVKVDKERKSTSK